MVRLFKRKEGWISETIPQVHGLWVSVPVLPFWDQWQPTLKAPSAGLRERCPISNVGKEKLNLKADLITFCFQKASFFVPLTFFSLMLQNYFGIKFTQCFWFLFSISISTSEILMGGREVILWVWRLSDSADLPREQGYCSFLKPRHEELKLHHRCCHIYLFF